MGKNKKQNILIIDGANGAFKGASYIIRKNGCVPYYLTSQVGYDIHIEVDGIDTSKANKAFSKASIDSLKNEVYEKCWSFPQFSNNEILTKFLPIAKELDLLTILPGNEGSVELADELLHLLKFKEVNDYKDRAIRRNKHLMQQRLKDYGIRYIPFVYTTSLSESLDFYKNECSNNKIVLKPNRSVAGIDVLVCKNEQEIKQAFTKISEGTNFYNEKNKAVLVEQYIGGTEYAIDCITSQNIHKPVYVQKYTKFLFNGNPIYIKSEVVGQKGQKDKKILETEIYPYLYKCLDAFGIKKGPTHTEIKFYNNKPYLIEMGARLAGNAYLKELKDCYKYDTRDLLIKTYLDNTTINSTEYNPRYFQSEVILFSNKTKPIKYFNLEYLLPKFKSFYSFEYSIGKSIGLLLKTTSLRLSNGSVFTSNKHVSEEQYQSDTQKIVYICLKFPELFWSNKKLTQKELNLFESILDDSFIVPKDFIEFID